jgi:hypothetical protein
LVGARVALATFVDEFLEMIHARVDASPRSISALIAQIDLSHSAFTMAGHILVFDARVVVLAWVAGSNGVAEVANGDFGILHMCGFVVALAARGVPGSML